MDVPPVTMVEVQKAVAFAFANPLSEVMALGISIDSSRDDVLRAFTFAYACKRPNGCETEFGKARINDGVQLFMQEREIPDFVARCLAGIALGQLKSPP